MAKFTREMGHLGIKKWPKWVKNALFGFHWESIGTILGSLWDCSEAFLTLFEPTNGPIYKGNGPFGHQNMGQNGSKMTLFKFHWESIGTILGSLWDCSGAFLTLFGPTNGPIYKGNRALGDQKMTQSRSKITLFKMHWEPIKNGLELFCKPGIFDPV